MYPSDVLMQSLVLYLFVACYVAILRITIYWLQLLLGWFLRNSNYIVRLLRFLFLVLWSFLLYEWTFQLSQSHMSGIHARFHSKITFSSSHFGFCANLLSLQGMLHPCNTQIRCILLISDLTYLQLQSLQLSSYVNGSFWVN